MVMRMPQPFGLIGSNWGGTRIEPWTPPEALEECDVPPDATGSTNPQDQYTALYNAMIHPLIRLSITGALWYQGMQNGCSPSSMVLIHRPMTRRVQHGIRLQRG